MSTVRELFFYGKQTLEQAGIDTPAADARFLLSLVLHVEPWRIPLLMHETVSHIQQEQFKELIAQRAARVPAAYLAGTREFYSLDFFVTPDVLIPRPETELLVDVVLSSSLSAHPHPILVDLGTGSGAISVTLAKHLPACRIIAVDISTAALAVATKNAEYHGVSNRIDFVEGDLFAPLPSDIRGAVHGIVSNPPYIPTGEIPHLAPEIKNFEPPQALDGGTDGLEFYRRISGEAPAWLAPGGLLAVEVGYDQGEKVAAMFAAAGLAEIALHRDLQGIPRVVSGKMRKTAF